LLRVVYVILAAGMLQSEAYGLLAYSQTWYIAVLPLAQLAVSLQFGRAIGRDRLQGLAFASATRSLRATVATAASILVCLVAALLEPVQQHLPAIVIFSGALVFRVMAAGSQAVLTALERADQTCFNNLLWRSVELVGAILILSAGLGILALATLHSSTWLLQAAHGWLRERRLACIALPRGEQVAQPDAWRVLVSDGLRLALAAFITGLLGSGMLILFRLLEGTGEEMGSLALLIQVVGIMLGLFGTLGNALLPFFARNLSDGGDFQERLAAPVVGSGVLLATLGALAGLLTPGTWVGDLLGAGYGYFHAALPAVALFAAPILWHVLAIRLLFTRSGSGRMVSAALVGTGIALSAAPLMIDLWGGHGALAAMLLGQSLQALLLLRFTHLKLNWKLRGLVYNLAAWLIAGALVLAVAVEKMNPLAAMVAMALLAMTTWIRLMFALLRR
jgi:hypothetical protein